MIEIIGNIWDFKKNGYFLGITTNGAINKKGECVMGRGIALQTKNKYPEFPILLAQRIIKYGNRVYCFPKYGLFTFPVKHTWKEKADLNLIKKSASQLQELIVLLGPQYQFILARPGCGNGKLTWEEVKPFLSLLEDFDNIRIIHIED